MHVRPYFFGNGVKTCYMYLQEMALDNRHRHTLFEIECIIIRSNLMEVRTAFNNCVSHHSARSITDK